MYGRYRLLRQRRNGLLNDPNLVMYRTIRLNDRKLFEGERGVRNHMDEYLCRVRFSNRRHRLSCAPMIMFGCVTNVSPRNLVWSWRLMLSAILVVRKSKVSVIFDRPTDKRRRSRRENSQYYLRSIE